MWASPSSVSELQSRSPGFTVNPSVTTILTLAKLSTEEPHDESQDHRPKPDIPNLTGADIARGPAHARARIVQDAPHTDRDPVPCTFLAPHSRRAHHDALGADGFFAAAACNACGLLLMTVAVVQTGFVTDGDGRANWHEFSPALAAKPRLTGILGAALAASHPAYFNGSGSRLAKITAGSGA